MVTAVKSKPFNIIVGVVDPVGKFSVKFDSFYILNKTSYSYRLTFSGRQTLPTRVSLSDMGSSMALQNTITE